jgi:hypothetical protein
MTDLVKFLQEGQNDRDAEGDSAFLAAIEPDHDFLPGALLVSDEKALAAARRVVDAAAARLGASTEWSGTVAVVRSPSGKTLDRVEIHGASYDREHDEASGVRFDMTGAKLVQD